MHERQASQDWGIVGGGILGMTLALRLAQSGHHVTLFEAADHLGGLADAWQLGGVTWDRHYHVTLLSDSHLRRILDELGLAKEMRWVETRTGFFTDGQLYSMSNSWEFLRFPPLGLIDKLRLGATIAYAARVKNWRRLEQIPVADWLRRLSGHTTFEKIWLPLLRAKLGENYRQTSAAFIWATIARLYAARRTGLKKEMFGYLPGGYARLLERFTEKLVEAGVSIRLHHRARRVLPQTGGRVEIDFAPLPGHDQNHHIADAVVLTTPSSVVSRLCPTLGARERGRHEQIQYQGIICASLLLRRPLSGFYVTNITDADFPFTGVIEMTALVDPRAFAGHTLVYLPKYVPVDDPAFALSDEDIEREFVAGLRRIHPDLRPEDVVAFRVSRVRNVMAISTLDYSRRLPRMETSLAGVYAINSAQIVNGTLNVNETVRLAQEACQNILLPRCAAPHGNESARYDPTDCQPIAGPR